jgi:hypothetical protein
LICWRRTETEARGLGGVTRGQDEVKLTRMAWDKWGKEEGMGMMARMMRTREEIQPRIPLTNNHLSTTPTVCPEPEAGSLLTINAAPQHCKLRKTARLTSLASAVAGLSSTPSQRLLHLSTTWL